VKSPFVLRCNFSEAPHLRQAAWTLAAIWATTFENYKRNVVQKNKEMRRIKHCLVFILALATNFVVAQNTEDTTSTTERGVKYYRNGEEVYNLSKGEKETKLEKVVLLSSNEELNQNTSVEDIKKLVVKTNKIFDELFRESSKSGKIMVQFELGKKKNNIQFAVRDDLDLEIMKEFEKRINQEKYPKTKSGTVKLQLIYKVNSFDDEE
jgi:hypothetical protein